MKFPLNTYKTFLPQVRVVFLFRRSDLQICFYLTLCLMVTRIKSRHFNSKSKFFTVKIKMVSSTRRASFVLNVVLLIILINSQHKVILASTDLRSVKILYNKDYYIISHCNFLIILNVFLPKFFPCRKIKFPILSF